MQSIRQQRPNVDSIYIHCSATHLDWMEGQGVKAKRDEIALWHTRDRKWRAIGYDLVIDRDGSVAIGRDLDGDGVAFEDVGAHTKGYNTKSISICLIGGATSSANDAFLDNFTPEQNESLRREIAKAQAIFGGGLKLRGHNEVAAKACPGFNVQRWFDNDAPARTNPLSSNTVKSGGAVGVLGTFGGVFGGLAKLDPIAQVAVVSGAIIIVGLSIFIVRDRLKKWAAGVR